MFNNYTLKSLLSHFSSSDASAKGVKSSSDGFKLGVVLTLLFAITSIQAQTTIIDPAGAGGFNNGSTFAANGWTVANQGVSPVKWAVGTAASGTTSVGSTTSASASVTLTAANANISVGQIVYGSGIPANTFVSAVSGTTLTLSQTATATASGVTLGFGMYAGGISVGTTQLTNASIAANTYSVTLAAANPNISVGMAIAPISGFIGANTYVASINGTTLGLSKASLNGSTLAVAQSMVFSATSAAISGNAAYVSNDNGLTNSYGGYPTNRTVYFYKDITTVPSIETAMTLTFDVKSVPTSGAGWQVWVAPTSQAVTGTDTQVTSPFTYGVSWPGATLISFNSNPQAATTKTTAFIPKSFAGTSFRLIFVWTNNTSAGTLPPAAIDNISLVSRMPEEITCAHSGLWSQTGTWDSGNVPTPADTVVLDNDGETVIIDSRYSGCEDMILAGTNTLVQYALSSVIDEFKINNDLNIAAGGARFNVHDGTTNGKSLKLGHNLDVGAGARFDSNVGGTTAFQGRLTLNGSAVQTVTVDSAGFIGGSAAGVNTSSNVANVLNQLEVTNTSTTIPNVVWDADGVRIKSSITLTTGRVSIASGKRFVLGNFSSLNNITCPPGYGITGGTLSKWMNSSNTYSVPAGTEYPGSDVSYKGVWYPFATANGQNRSLYFMPDANASVAGEVAITYTDANTVTGSLSIADGSYTINNRYDGNFAFSTPDATAISGTPIVYAANTTTPNNRVGVYANGAFEAIDGSARLMNASAALSGTHQNGTTQPFVFRKDLSLSSLTASPIYIGTGSASMLNTATAITSASSGDWNTASTWVGGVVPSCSSVVTIAAGHNVTVTTVANAAGVVIAKGATLTNNAGTTTMTVGCTNNNAAFYNYGTHTMTAGKLKVNGSVSHKDGSFFNQTGGEIIIDSNNNGNAATSVAFGGSSCKIETSNLALTGGKITIVDPLVNESTPVNVTTATSLNLNTAGAAGSFTWNTSGSAASGQATIVMQNPNYFSVGQVVTGTGIPAGTTVLSVTPATVGFTPPTTLVLSNNLTATIANNSVLSFSAMHNGSSSVVLEGNVANSNLSIGQAVSGTGIQSGTTITAITTTTVTGYPYKLTLSQPISGLSTSPITAQQALSFAAVSIGGPSVLLSAVNPSLMAGMPVSGTGLLDGTFITEVNGLKVTFSAPVQSGAPTPLVFNAYTFNTLSSGSFVYSSPNHYATGLNHTLQIGDGVSTQKASVLTNGFNCQFQQLGGLFSMGNLTVNAPDGANRFMHVSSNNINNGYNMNVQNAFTITAGSAFKKTNGNATVYVGGNIVNDGAFYMPWGSTPLYLGNFINGVAVPSTLPQTIAGSGTFAANQYALTGTYASDMSVNSITINNTSSAGVTLSVPNFRASSVVLTNGILHTSAAYPIYCGFSDVMNAAYFSGTYGAASSGSNTTHIDGPCVHANKYDTTITQYKMFPTGKNGKYMPIMIASTGGVELMVEAFDTNSGSINPTNASNLSASRWKVTRVGSAGGFTGYNVRIGDKNAPVTASNIIVHSATANGTYDVVSTPTSATTYEAAYFGTNVPTLYLATAQTGGFLGNYAYATSVACTGTPAPGATIASASSVCSSQSVALSLTNATTGSGVTYQWQSSTDGGSTWGNISGATAATYVATPSANTSYRCNVTCSSNVGTSTPVAVTVSESTVTTTGAEICSPGVASLSATGSSILNWYDAATGGNLVATGASYSPNVTSTTTYYVASASASSSSVNTGTWTGSAASSALFKGIAFDATNKLKLKTVTVYPKNTVALTPITIALYDATGNLVSGTSPVTFTPTLNTGAIGTVSQVVTLNYNVPVGTGYRLVATNGLIATTNTLGNSTAAITYPTTGALRLTGNVSALTDAVATTGATTNCFHNLTYDELCESVTRTPVTATVVMETSSSTVSICKLTGATASISVGATAVSGVTYQWYSQAATSSTWVLLSNNANYAGVNAPTLNITRTSATLPATGTKYKIEISSGSCGSLSSIVTLQDQTVLAKVTAPKVVTVLAPALTTCAGSSVALSLAVGSIGNIQLQSSTDGIAWNNSGSVVAQSAVSALNPAMTFNTGVLTQDTWFRFMASNGVCSSVVSTSVKITVSTTPDAGTISGGNVMVCMPVAAALDLSGATVAVTNTTTLTLTGSSLGATILWEKCINYLSNTPTWAAAGSTTTSLTVTDLKASTWYRAKVTNGACIVYTGAVKITVTPTAKAGVVTSTVNNVVSASVCYGGNITFASAVYVGNSIQWEVSTVSATTGFAPVSGATGQDFTMTNVSYASLSKFYVRSVVTSGGCTISRSAVKTILVNPTSVAGTVTGGGTVCNSGLAGTLKLAGNTGTIQWQYSTDGVNYTNAPKATAGTAPTFTTTSASSIAATYVVSNVTSDTYFRALVTSGACSSSVSNVVQYVVGTAAVAGTATAASSEVCPTFGTTITLAGSTGSIVWKKSTNWLATTPTWAAVTTSVTPTLATGALAASTAYKAVVTIGGCSTVESNVVVVIVTAKPVSKGITANVTSPAGAATTPLCTSSSSKVLTVTAGYVGNIQWQSSTTSTTAGFADISGETATTYTVSGASVGANYFRVKFTNACGLEVFSPALTVYYTSCLVNNNTEEPVLLAKAPFGVVVYPNPSSENFNFNLSTSSEEKVSVVVYDMTGKLVDQREVAPTEVSELQLGDRYPSGVYNMIVTQGDNTKTLRVVKR